MVQYWGMSGKICDRPAVSHITEPDATHTLEQQGPSRVSFIAFCQCLLFHVCRFIFYLSWRAFEKDLPILSLFTRTEGMFMSHTNIEINAWPLVTETSNRFLLLKTLCTQVTSRWMNLKVVPIYVVFYYISRQFSFCCPMWISQHHVEY